jgi:hypothetical protein
MPPIASSIAGLVAGLLTVLVIDRFLWPGTFVHGAVGVIVAVVVLWLFGQRSSTG